VNLLDAFLPLDVVAVRDSLDCGDDWKPTAYPNGGLTYLTHVETGIYVWTRNRPYGLEIYDRLRRSLWGGVTCLSSFYLSPGHWSLYFAIRRWERRHAADIPTPGAKVSAAQLLRAKTPSGDAQ
jgi:hypothetical protein